MKEVFRYNSHGQYVEPVIIFPDDDGNYSIPNDCTEVPLPERNWKPIFKEEEGKWIETITDEELEKIRNPSEPSLPDNVVLGQQLTQREIEAMEQGQKITDLEIESMVQGQLATDMELRLMILEASINV